MQMVEIRITSRSKKVKKIWDDIQEQGRAIKRRKEYFSECWKKPLGGRPKVLIPRYWKFVPGDVVYARRRSNEFID